MKILHALLTCAVVSAVLAPVADAAVTSKTEHVGRFDGISLQGHFRLVFHRNAAESVTLSGDPYLVDNLRVGVHRGVLAIVRPEDLDLPKNEAVLVTITAPNLASLSAAGLVRAEVTGLDGRGFKLINRGALAATLSGNAGHVAIKSSGVASINASALHARTIEISVRGQGNMRVFASHAANVTMYGEGRIDVLGNPKEHSFRSLAYGVVTMH